MASDASEKVSLRGRPLHDLERHGQVVWLSYLRRNLLVDRNFRRLIEEYAVSGVSFDAGLFAHAISGSQEYRAAIERLRARGLSPERILDDLLIEDVCLAAAALREARPAELGGWVAVGVPPRHRVSVDAIVSWVALLEEATGSDRVLVKLPASAAGLRAVEGVLAAGHSVYVDQIFGLQQLERTLESHARGLGLRLASGGDFESVRFVAAMHLLRIDVAVDELLRDRRREAVGDPDMVESLHGRAAIALGKLAWRRLREWDGEARQAELTAKGARPAWLAWEGTRTLSPARRDVEYLEELIGPRTISVVSRLALGAFRDHGETGATVGRQHEEAREIVDDLRSVGVDPDVLADDLQEAATATREAGGVRMLAALAPDATPGPRMTIEPGELDARVEDLEREADRLGLARRLWERDPTLWPVGVEDPARIRDRLGWLGLPESMSEEALPVLGSRTGDGDSPVSVILLGMGGSSLGAEACRLAFGKRRFVVLDTTVPAGVAAVAARADAAGAIFVVASKSGTTIETRALADYFWERADDEDRGSRWVAITDPGTPLHELARRRGFQRVWLNPPDVGGRYSVLSYFGLVPMALMGVDIGQVMASATRMAVVSGAEIAAAHNPAIRLGLLLTAALDEGRDKLTLLTSPRLAGLADWIEQLVAESTGKQGRGLVPVSREPLGAPESYGNDRLFVQLCLEDDVEDSAQEEVLRRGQSAGAPVVRIRLADPHELGGEFLRWQLAVATCGALAGFDPFDEPDVSGAKVRTRELLAARDTTLEHPDPPLAENKLISLHGDGERLGVPDRITEPAEVLRACLRGLEPPEYLAIQAFLSPEEETWHALQGLRALIRDRTGMAATAAWGPRFLHSTGQLHKGGGDRGVFLQLTSAVSGDLAIPGHDYSFGTLARAQALGDYRTLRDAGRRVLQVHFGGSTEAGLATLLDEVRRALG